VISDTRRGCAKPKARQRDPRRATEHQLYVCPRDEPAAYVADMAPRRPGIHLEPELAAVNETVYVSVQNDKGGVERCSVSVVSTATPGLCKLSLLDGPLPGVFGEGSDLFVALRELRTKIEEFGHRLLCNGARIDSWPSPMSRDMGRARKVYLTRLGRATTRSDLVDIFGHADPALIGTVTEQENYHDEWMASL
jgi:hypothetical protein